MDTLTEKRTAKSVFLRHPWLRRLVAGILAIAIVISLALLNGQTAKVRESADTVQTTTEPEQTTELPLQSTLNDDTVNVTAPWDATEEPAEETETPAETLSEFASYLELANSAVAQQDYETALGYAESCEAAASTVDERATALVLIGNINFYQADYASALTRYEAARSREQTVFPESAICGMLARCWMLLDDMEHVVTVCTEGIAALTGEDDAATAADLYVLRGTAYLYLERYAEAAADFQLSIDNGYDDPDTLREQISLCEEILSGASGTVVSGGGSSGSVAIDEASLTALSYYATGQYAQAATAFESVYSAGSSYYSRAQICSNIAKCRLLLGEYETALTWCNTGLNAGDSSENPTLYSLRGTAYMALGQNLAAAKDYDAAIAGGYTDTATLNAQSAACYYFAALYDDAVRCASAAVAAGSADSVLWLALSAYMLTDYATAITALRQSLELTQTYCDKSELYRLLTRSCLLTNAFTDAADAATQGLAALVSEGVADGATIAEFYALRGAAYQSAADYQLACDDFQAALEYGYTNPYELWKQSTLCCFLLGDYEAATENGEKALAAGTPTSDLYYWIGLSWFSLEQYEKAETMFVDCADTGEPQENLYFYLGVCRFSLEDYEAAVDYFTTSIDRGETAERCLYNRGLCYLQLKDYDLAREDLEAAAEQDTDTAVSEEATTLLESLKSVLY